jgi:hypothetical protein
MSLIVGINSLDVNELFIIVNVFISFIPTHLECFRCIFFSVSEYG